MSLMISDCVGVAQHMFDISDDQRILDAVERFRKFAFNFRLSRCKR